MSVDFTEVSGINIPGPINGTANQSAFSIMGWIRLRNLPVGANVTFFNWGNGLGLTRASIQASSVTPGALIVNSRSLDSDALQASQTVSGTAISAGPWLHLLASINYPNQFIQVFVNAIDFPLSTQPTYGGTATSNVASTNAKLGATINANTNIMNGLLEDVRIYSRAFSIAEAMEIFTAKGTDGIYQGLIQRYPLLDGSENTAVVGVDNVSDTDRIIGTLTTGTANFGSTITTARRMRMRRPS